MFESESIALAKGSCMIAETVSCSSAAGSSRSNLTNDLGLKISLVVLIMICVLFFAVEAKGDV